MKHILNAKFTVQIWTDTNKTYHVRGYEMPPSKRTLVTHIRGKSSYYRVQFPYTYFFIHTDDYSRFCHLKVGMRPQPLAHSDSKLYNPLIPNAPDGWVCLGHPWNEKPKFTNIEQLSHDVVDAFFFSPFTDNLVYIPLKNSPPLVNFQQWHDASKQFDKLPINFSGVDSYTLNDSFQDIEFLP